MRSRRRIHVNTIGGSGGGSQPTFGNVAWGPNFGGDDGDQFGVQVAIELSEIGMAGAFGVNAAISLDEIAMAGSLGVNAAIDMQEIGMQATQTVGVQITGSYVVEDFLPNFDTYLDEGSPNTANDGATSLLCKTASAVPGSDAQRSYLAWDLTGFAGTPNTASIDIEASTSLGVGENASFQVYTDPSQPINASSTWNNTETPAGTLRETIVQAVTTTPTVYTLTLGSATRSNMMGNWLYLRILGTSSAGLATITLTSREGTNQPTLTFEADL